MANDGSSPSTGILLPFERTAMHGGEMPDGLTGSEQKLFLSLRMLYRQNDMGVVSRDAAVMEKKKLMQAFEVDRFRDECGKHSVELWKAAEAGANAYGHERTLENADMVIEAIYGVKKKGAAT